MIGFRTGVEADPGPPFALLLIVPSFRLQSALSPATMVTRSDLVAAAGPDSVAGQTAFKNAVA
jgi:hypothetical protein